jgi:hypothetical protein
MKFEDFKNRGWYRAIQILWGFLGILVLIGTVSLIWDSTESNCPLSNSSNTSTEAEKYTIEELGARLKTRNPELFGQFSDAELGKKLLEEKPEFQRFLKSSTDVDSVAEARAQGLISPTDSLSDQMRTAQLLGLISSSKKSSEETCIEISLLIRYLYISLGIFTVVFIFEIMRRIFYYIATGKVFPKIKE